MARFADFEVNGERLPAEFFLDWAKVSINSQSDVLQRFAHVPVAVSRLQKTKRNISAY